MILSIKIENERLLYFCISYESISNNYADVYVINFIIKKYKKIKIAFHSPLNLLERPINCVAKGRYAKK
jgi:hypothetical protein